MAQTLRTAEKGRAADKPVVLVTGASGFIGNAVIERLSDRYTVVGLEGDRRDPTTPAALNSVTMPVKLLGASGQRLLAPHGSQGRLRPVESAQHFW